MTRTFECPKCGTDISDTYEGDDPSVGITGGWFCDACNEGYGDEEGYEPHDDDVSIGPISHGASPAKCACGVPYEMGYGLAGGGMGAYSYCPKCSTIGVKTQDQT